MPVLAPRRTASSTCATARSSATPATSAPTASPKTDEPPRGTRTRPVVASIRKVAHRERHLWPLDDHDHAGPDRPALGLPVVRGMGGVAASGPLQARHS